MSNKNLIIQQIENAQLKTDLPEFGPGDTVVVQVKVKEGNRERLQAFEGVVIGKRNRGLNSAFTVRKISAEFFLALFLFIKNFVYIYTNKLINYE